MKLNENLIQYNLMRWLRKNNSDVFVPNYYIGSFECDLLRLTGNDMLVEYEIKITRSDFKSDFEKSLFSWKQNEKVTKHDIVRSGKRVNRFYYVVPEGMISPDDLPAGFGLIYASEPYKVDTVLARPCNVYINFSIVKMSKLFTKENLAEKKYRHIAQNLCFKLENQKRIALSIKSEINHLRKQSKP